MDVLGSPLSEVIEFPTGRRPRALVAELVRRIARLREERPSLGECVGVGVVVSGLVDLEGGRLKYSPTLGWRDVDLPDAAAGGHQGAGRGRELHQGLCARPGLGGAG